MAHNKALLEKLQSQTADAIAKATMKANDYARFHKDQRYWLVNSSNRRSDRPVTMEEFVAYLGPKATLGVYKQYTLVPAC